MPSPERVYHGSIRAFSLVFIAIGLALLAVTLAAGGGPLSLGVLMGLVTFEDVRRVPQADWPITRVDRVMTPAGRLSVLPPNARADQALDELARRDVEQIPITEGEHLLGLVRRPIEVPLECHAV